MDRNNLQAAAAKGGEGKNNVCSHHIVAMPYPATGHINPMMNLCKLLVSRIPQILITFVVTEECLASISSDDDSCPQNIVFETIPANTIPVLQEDKDAFLVAVMTKMEAPFMQILDRLHLPVTAIITDTFLPWAVGTGNRRNIPVTVLWITSASALSICYHCDLFKEKQFPIQLQEHAEDVIDFIPGISSIRAADVPSFIRDKKYPIDSKFYRLPISGSQYLLCASVYELESQVYDVMKENISIPVYSVGPLIPYKSHYNCKSSTQDPHYMEWLNSQPTSSILYVSVGSFLAFSSAQLDEMVAGVKLSGIKCLWVGRDNTGRLQDELGDLGLVVPWCDQLRVLSHSSVGGFLTHCGYNSTVEGAFAGVPMLTFPIFGDQFPVSKQIVEDWKIGMRLNKGENQVIKREEIAKIIQTFMDTSSEERKELLKRSKQVQDIIQTALAKGGSSDTNLDAFIKNITQGQPHCH